MMQNFCKSFFIFIFLLTVLVPKDSYADNQTGIGRERICYSNGNMEDLEFDPTSGGKDVEFVMTNEVCLASIASTFELSPGAGDTAGLGCTEVPAAAVAMSLIVAVTE